MIWQTLVHTIPGSGHLCAAHGSLIDGEAEYVEAVRVRLGAGGPPDIAMCGLCGRTQLHAAGGHASCCSLGEATARHIAVRDCLLKFSSAADPAGEWGP